MTKFTDIDLQQFFKKTFLKILWYRKILQWSSKMCVWFQIMSWLRVLVRKYAAEILGMCYVHNHSCFCGIIRLLATISVIYIIIIAIIIIIIKNHSRMFWKCFACTKFIDTLHKHSVWTFFFVCLACHFLSLFHYPSSLNHSLSLICCTIKFTYHNIMWCVDIFCGFSPHMHILKYIYKHKHKY